MAKPRYRHAHQQQRARLTPLVEAGEAYCAQPVCVMSTRWIPPDAAWDVAHDDSGTVTLGPAHRKCNRRDGAVRGNRMRGDRRREDPQPALNRWVL